MSVLACEGDLVFLARRLDGRIEVRTCDGSCLVSDFPTVADAKSYCADNSLEVI